MRRGGVAQLGERRVRNAEVGSSILLLSTTHKKGCQAKRADAATQRELAALAEAGIAAPGSFEAVAREWFAKNEPTWAESHSDKIIRRLERDVFPWIGARPVSAPAGTADLQALWRAR